MPSLSFVLPHWLYWGVLLLFPLLAMALVARQRRRGAPREPLLFNAYLFWLTSGFMGLHRMYLKSWWGFVYLPLFVAILFCAAGVVVMGVYPEPWVQAALAAAAPLF